MIENIWKPLQHIPTVVSYFSVVYLIDRFYVINVKRILKLLGSYNKS